VSSIFSKLLARFLILICLIGLLASVWFSIKSTHQFADPTVTDLDS